MYKRSSSEESVKLYRFIATLSFAVIFTAIPLDAQTDAQPKAAPSPGSPFAAESSSTPTAQMSERESQLRASLAKEPESTDLLYDLALLLQKENKPRESLDIYTEAAKKRKPTAEELRSVALDYVLLNDYDDAIHWLEPAARMAPSDVNVLYALGRCYYSNDRYEEAGHLFERVLSIEPQHLKAEENLGLVYDATHRTAEAEQALRKAASWANANGSDEWPFLDLGNFLLEQDRARDALDPLRTAAGIRPKCASCHEKLGRALLESNNAADGIAELEEAERLDPQDPKTHYELGRALRQAGKDEQAQREFHLSQDLYKAHSQQ